MVESSDQRDFKRMVVDCGISFRMLGADAFQSGTARNLSATGMLLICEQGLKPGDLLEVSLRPEKGLVPPFHAIVEVLRVDRPDPGGPFEVGCGIREVIG